jgi:hypothetical protein
VTASDFLRYEASLLLVKYGREAVLKAIAGKLNCSETELETLLAQIEKQKPVTRRSRPVPAPDQIEAIVRQHPDKASQLRSLYGRFQNRTFLPELRDVRRLFQQHSENPGHTKSRAASFAKVFNLLAHLDASELDVLCRVSESGEPSSLGIISDEILRRDR